MCREMKEMQKSRIDKCGAKYGHYLVSGNTPPNQISSSHNTTPRDLVAVKHNTLTHAVQSESYNTQHSESADICQGRSGQLSDSRSGIPIRMISRL